MLGGRGFHGRLCPLKQIFPVSSFSYNKTTWAVTWCFVHAQWIAMRAKKTRTDACLVLPPLLCSLRWENHLVWI